MDCAAFLLYFRLLICCIVETVQVKSTDVSADKENVTDDAIDCSTSSIAKPRTSYGQKTPITVPATNFLNVANRSLCQYWKARLYTSRSKWELLINCD